MLYIIFVVFCISLNILDAESATNIVGGDNSQNSQFPYQVSLQQSNQHICGGSVLDARWILTAAHCLSGQNAQQLSILAGTIDLQNGGERRQVERIVIHENYNSQNSNNDIGLVKLSSDLPFSNKIRPITPSRRHMNTGDQVILSGWGLTRYPSSSIPRILQNIDLDVISNQQCRRSYRIVPSMICTLTKQGEGACQGDSGGPLVYEGEQVGVVSFGVPCAVGRPDVYTRVEYFVNWINQNKQ